MLKRRKDKNVAPLGCVLLEKSNIFRKVLVVVQFHPSGGVGRLAYSDRGWPKHGASWKIIWDDLNLIGINIEVHGRRAAATILGAVSKSWSFPREDVGKWAWALRKCFPTSNLSLSGCDGLAGSEYKEEVLCTAILDSLCVKSSGDLLRLSTPNRCNSMPVVSIEKKSSELISADRLSEIYGISDEEDEDICKVCWETDRCVVLLPCAHLGICETCSTDLSLCPFCRIPVEEKITIARNCEYVKTDAGHSKQILSSASILVL